MACPESSTTAHSVGFFWGKKYSGMESHELKRLKAGGRKCPVKEDVR